MFQEQVLRMFSAASNDLDDDDGVRPARSLPRPGRRHQPVVMVVDDDRETAEMYSLALKTAGFKAIPLSDVSALFLSLDEEVPDVVVLDFHLGGIISGVNVLENLRLDPRTSDVIAFILSNHDGKPDGAIDRAFSAGAVAWLPKVEITPAQLTDRVIQALASRNAELNTSGADGFATDALA